MTGIKARIIYGLFYNAVFNNINDILEDFNHWIRCQISKFGTDFYISMFSLDTIAANCTSVSLLQTKDNMYDLPVSNLLALYEVNHATHIPFCMIEEELYRIVQRNADKSFHWKTVII